MPEVPIALVTGSGKKRVGAAVAEALARKGYSIALHYRTSAADEIVRACITKVNLNSCNAA